MSGHSKWSTIKRKKGAADAARGKLFTKLIKEIMVAARMGGSDVDANPRLRTAVDKAKANSMPKDNIARAIAKGAGELEGAAYEEFTFEGYGPGGVAVMVGILTDNRNRTTASVRHAFTKHGGNLGENGCVSYLFDRKGVLTFEKDKVEEDKLMEIALEHGAEDVRDDGDVFTVLTDPDVFNDVNEALVEAGYTDPDAEVTMVPQTTIEVTGKTAVSVMKMIETLEDDDDVQHVYSNFDISDEDMEAMSA
ncbi:MAG: YebC/PmpR family DNA-binding transcriptional regulator [Deltaproteobacteria bacterium]|nr:YebC/PmpR family DNA-binding transcriptional regulator [Deltaproteobacteria bacterium]MCB9489473.1 YebC/PmpR family DNA-binding transcriptional regulator [Deltaproteobacteria bacterium]